MPNLFNFDSQTSLIVMTILFTFLIGASQYILCQKPYKPLKFVLPVFFIVFMGISFYGLLTESHPGSQLYLIIGIFGFVITLYVSFIVRMRNRNKAQATNNAKAKK